MADEEVTFSIILKDAFSKSSKAIRGALNEFVSGFKGTGAAAKQATQGVKGARDEFGRFKKTGDDAKRSLTRFQRVFQALGRVSRTIVGAFRRVGSAVVKLGQKFRNFGRGASNALRGLARQLFSLRTTILGAIAVFAGIRAVDFAADVERGFAEVLTIIGDIGEREAGRLKVALFDAAREGGQTIKDEIGAAYQAISSGVQGQQLVGFLRTANKLATAGVTDVQSSVELLTTVLNAFGKSADEAETVSDALFKTVERGRTTIPQLSRSLFQVAPAAAAAGVEIQDVLAAISTLTASGTPTRVATTQLRQAIVELADDTSEAGQAFRAVANVSFREFIRNGGTLVQAMSLIRDRAQQTGQSVGQLFGAVEAGLAAQTLAGEGLAKFGEDLEVIRNAAGATDKAFGRLSQTFGFAFQQFRTSFGDLVDALLGQALPALTRVFKQISSVLSGFATLARRAQQGGISDQAVFDRVLRQLFSTLTNFFVGVAKTFGVIVIETIAQGLKILTPVLEDVFRDSLGQVLSVIPGVDIAPSLAANVIRQEQLVAELQRTIEQQEAAAFRQLRRAESLEAAGEAPAARRARREAEASFRVLRDQRRQFADETRKLLSLEKQLTEENKAQTTAVADAFTQVASTSVAAVQEFRDQTERDLKVLKGAIDEAIGEPIKDAAEDAKRSSRTIFQSFRSAFDQARDRVVGFFESIRQEAARTASFNRRNAGLLLGFTAREAETRGDTAAAQRAQLQAAQLKERIELQTALGNEFERVEARLLRLQSAEREALEQEIQRNAVTNQRVAFQERLNDVVQDATRAEQSFANAVTLQNEEQEAGVVITDQRRAALEQQRKELIRTLTQTAAALQELAGDARFGDQAVAQLERIRIKLAQLRGEGEGLQRTLGQGVRQAFRDLQAESAISFEFIRETVKTVANTIATSLTDAIGQVIDGTASAEDAFRAFGRQVLQTLAEIITQQLIHNAISGFGGAGAAAAANSGGRIQAFARGGPVPGPNVNRDVVPAVLTPGEYVIPRGAVNYYGAGVMEAIRRMMLPRSAVAGLGVGPVTNVAGRHFNTGGRVSEQGQGGQSVVFNAFGPEEFEQMLAAHQNQLIRFMGQKKSQINAQLGKGTA